MQILALVHAPSVEERAVQVPANVSITITESRAIVLVMSSGGTWILGACLNVATVGWFRDYHSRAASEA